MRQNVYSPCGNCLWITVASVSFEIVHRLSLTTFQPQSNEINLSVKWLKFFCFINFEWKLASNGHCSITNDSNESTIEDEDELRAEVYTGLIKINCLLISIKSRIKNYFFSSFYPLRQEFSRLFCSSFNFLHPFRTYTKNIWRKWGKTLKVLEFCRLIDCDILSP